MDLEKQIFFLLLSCARISSSVNLDHQLQQKKNINFSFE